MNSKRYFRCLMGTFMIACVVFPLQAQLAEQLPAFPQAEGFGAYALGGRGGKVIFVDNLKDDGPGSLRAAVEDPEPRIVIFRISGTIELRSELRIQHPYITIAGQTAPGDGICLKNFPLNVYQTHDVIIRGIRVRTGIEFLKEGESSDGIDVHTSHDVIIDHCSFGWSTDEILNTYKDNRKLTIQWCIFSESLNNSVHRKGEHGYAATIGGSMASYHHNLLAHNKGRNPSIGGNRDRKTEMLDFRNNVVYNWVSRVCDGKPRSINFASNYYKPGPATLESHKALVAEIQPSEKYGYTSRWFIQSNLLEGYPGFYRDNWSGAVLFEGEGTSMETNREYLPFDNFAYRTRDVAQVYLEVLDHAGATVPRRDPVDQRVIEDVRTGGSAIGNGIIDRVEQVGGWPKLLTYDVPLDSDNDGMPDAWESLEGLDINDPTDRFGIKEGEVYDNLERYLNDLASDKAFLLPPVHLSASLQNETEVLLSWEDISDSELGFVIQRADAGGPFMTIAAAEANATSYVDLRAGQEGKQLYRVFAISEQLRSLPSKSATPAMEK